MFKYVFIPADASEPISIVKASKSGGLTNDELIKQARKYFIENTNERNQKKSDNNDTNNKSDSTSDIDPECLKRIELLEKATPQEKKQIADRIRKQYSTKGGGNTVGVPAVESKISTMDDEEVIQLLKLQEQQKMQQESSSSSSSMTSCEITCLTIPTKLNQHTAVSMYGDDTARTKNYPFNTRATNLMTACGHAFPQNSSASSDGSSPRNTVVMGGEEDGKPSGMYGDVFIGRSIDDETNDIWERVDLLPEEVGGNSNSNSGIATVSELNKIAWCKIAKKKGGGGGMGGGRGGSAPSLKNTIQKFQQAAMTEATSSATSSNSTSTPTITNVDDDGNDIIHDEDELNYTWIQTNEELEMKFVVPITTTTKHVQVKFGMKSLKVTLHKVVLCEGDLWDEIVVDGSTYTFQNENKTKQTKEICVSLEKHNQGQTWNYVIEEE